MTRLSQFWNRLHPGHQRMGVVGLLLGSALLIFTLLALMVPEPRKIGERKTIVKHLLTDADPRSLGIEGLASQLRQLSQQNESLLSRIGSLEDQNKQTRANEAERQRKLGNQDSEETRADLNALKGEITALREAQQRTASVKPPESAADQVLPGQSATGIKKSGDDRDALFERSTSGKLTSGKGGLEIRLIRAGLDTSASKGKPAPGAAVPPHKSTVSTAGDDSDTVFIPAGTLLSGNLLNGLDAPTGKKASKEPFPVLARIKQEAILPNRFRADLRECFLIAAGYGDLSAERAYIRAETLSCVRSDGGVIEVPLDAYAVGEDGKLGLRGTLVSKQGQLMATSLLAGFAKGFSDAFSRVQVPVLMTGSAGAIGSSVPYQSNFNGGAIEGGGLRGAGYSMDRMAHYYMDLAENLFPVIEIDATRQIEFVVQRGTLLKLYNPKDLNRPVRSSTRLH